MMLKYKNLVQLLKERKKSDQGIWFIEGENEVKLLTYPELYQKSVRVLAGLQKKGVQVRDEVILQIQDNESFLVAYWGCLLGGIIPVPIPEGKNEENKKRFQKVWNQLSHPHVIGYKEILEEVSGDCSPNQRLDIESLMKEEEEGEVYDAEPTDIAMIQFSSGSTGNPKGVMLTHENILTNADDIATGIHCVPEDSTLSWMPLTHDMELIGFHLSSIEGGISQYLMPTSLFLRYPKLWLKMASKFRISILAAPNFGFKLLLSSLSSKVVENWDLSNVRLVLNGAEPISGELCQTFLQAMSRYQLKSNVILPVYGLAEASLVVTFPPVGESLLLHHMKKDSLSIGDIAKEESTLGEGITFVDLGYPVEHCKVRICDEKNQIQKDMVIGQIQICGENVSKGYYQNETATREAITLDGWMNTGDIGFLHQGRLTVMGRAKEIIFVHGQNYYPRDFEERIAHVITEEAAVCGISNDTSKTDDICIFVKYTGDEEAFLPLIQKVQREINRTMGVEVKQVLPVNDIPKTSSGKIQRFQLAEAYKQGAYQEIMTRLQQLINQQSKMKYRSLPENEIQRNLLTMWKTILKKTEIGINENFFEIGGDSLKASILLAKIEEQFQINIPLHQAFELMTIKKISEYIEGAKRKEQNPITVCDETEYYPLSSAQKRLFILNQAHNDTTYNITEAIRIKGNFDVARFEQAYQKLLHRNESFRTSFLIVDGQPVQKISNNVETIISHITCGYDEVSDEMKKFIQPFDLGIAPLIRVKIMKLSACEHIVVFDMHHIISDGMSCSIMLREIIQLYEGNEPQKQRIQYKDYAKWQERQQNLDYFKEKKEYWRRQFADEIPVLNLPTDFKRPATQSFEGSVYRCEVSNEIRQQLEQFAVTTGTTLYLVLLSIYYVLLYKYTGQEDIVVGTPVSGRTRAEISDVIGMFVNTLPIRNMPKPTITFQQFLFKVKENFLAAFEHQEYQFDMMVDEFKVKRSTNRNPMFDTMFVLQNMEGTDRKTDEFTMERYIVPSDISKFDITLQIIPEDGRLLLEFEYDTKLFRASTMEQFAAHYQNIIDNILRQNDCLISDIDMLSEQEKDLLCNHMNNANLPYPKEKTIEKLFEEQAEKHPDQIAVMEGDRQVTYAVLNQMSNRLAYQLIEHGIERNRLVGIVMNRTIEMVIGILAVLKAGGAYLPIAPQLPLQRKEYILKNSGATCVLVKEMFQSEDISACQIIVNAEDEDIIFKKEWKNPETKTNPSDIAYTIYTSGSTGNPKGVMVSHQALNNFLHNIKASYDNEIGQSDHCLSVANVSFDVNVAEVFMPLVFGATLVLYEQPGVTDLELFARTIEEKQITFAYLPPTILKEINKLLQHKKIKLNKILTGVEPILDEDLEVYFKLNPEMKIINGYGPTETTICATFYRYQSHKTAGHKVPIGKPLANTQVYLLNKERQLVPYGAYGELCISGDGMAIGYLHQEELTRKAYVSHPFYPGKRMYVTGDICRWDFDGNLEFMGRVDQQVKIRGYRIELGEIEAVLRMYPGIKEAVVLAREDANHSKFLCAYIVSEKHTETEEYKSFLRGKLPDYMIPVCYMKLDKIPITQNGKIDRKALPEPSFESNVTYVAPRNDIEAELVEVWKEVLGLKQISIYDNFFELGGNSLKAIQVSGRLKNFALSMQHIMEYPTIAELSKYVVSYHTQDEKLPAVMEENLKIDYYFNSEGERDKLTEIMDCSNLMLYFLLKKQVANHGDYHEYFAQGFNIDVTLDQNNNLYDMNCFSYHLRNDIVQITNYSGVGKQAMTHIEQLLDQGEQVIIDVFCLRNPAFKEFESFSAPEQKQRRGHVFMLVAHDKDNLYYVEMPDGINASNYIPYKGNKSVGILPKADIMPAFEIEVYYSTAKIVKEQLKKKTNLKDFVHSFLDNYNKMPTTIQGLTTYYGKSAFEKLIELATSKKLYLNQRENRYKRTLQDVIHWKFELIVWRRRLFQTTLEHNQDTYDEAKKQKAIHLLEDSANRWEKLYRTLTKQYQENQVVDEGIGSEFHTIEEQDEQLMCLLAKL